MADGETARVFLLFRPLRAVFQHARFLPFSTENARRFGLQPPATPTRAASRCVGVWASNTYMYCMCAR